MKMEDFSVLLIFLVVSFVPSCSSRRGVFPSHPPFLLLPPFPCGELVLPCRSRLGFSSPHPPPPPPPPRPPYLGEVLAGVTLAERVGVKSLVFLLVALKAEAEDGRLPCAPLNKLLLPRDSQTPTNRGERGEHTFFVQQAHQAKLLLPQFRPKHNVTPILLSLELII